MIIQATANPSKHVEFSFIYRTDEPLYVMLTKIVGGKGITEQFERKIMANEILLDGWTFEPYIKCPKCKKEFEVDSEDDYKVYGIGGETDCPHCGETLYMEEDSRAWKWSTCDR